MTEINQRKIVYKYVATTLSRLTKRSLLNCLTNNKLTFPLLKLHLNAFNCWCFRVDRDQDKKELLTECQACMYFIWINIGEECRNAGIWIHELWTTIYKSGCWLLLFIFPMQRLTRSWRYCWPWAGWSFWPGRGCWCYPWARCQPLASWGQRRHRAPRGRTPGPSWPRPPAPSLMMQKSYFSVSSNIKWGKLSEQYQIPVGIRAQGTH